MPVAQDVLQSALSTTLEATSFNLPGFARYDGKVRDCFTRDGVRVLVTTDRISAFDRVLGTIPLKGQVLNACARSAFAATQDLVRNHLIATPHPNVVVAHECQPILLEFVVRAYLTGVTSTSIWTHYNQGARVFAGHPLPEGLSKNVALPKPIVTPSTKAEKGGHDETISKDEAFVRGIISPTLYERAEEVALQLFARGSEIARQRGLILADTKYELGLLQDEIVVIDEIHTPDSSRYWFAETYHARLAEKLEPESFDKEYVRRYLHGIGYQGEGPTPPLPDEVRITAAQKYIEACERVTGQSFVPTLPNGAGSTLERDIEIAILDYLRQQR